MIGTIQLILVVCAVLLGWAFALAAVGCLNVRIN